MCIGGAGIDFPSANAHDIGLLERSCIEVIGSEIAADRVGGAASSVCIRPPPEWSATRKLSVRPSDLVTTNAPVVTDNRRRQADFPLLIAISERQRTLPCRRQSIRNYPEPWSSFPTSPFLASFRVRDELLTVTRPRNAEDASRSEVDFSLKGVLSVRNRADESLRLPFALPRAFCLQA